MNLPVMSTLQTLENKMKTIQEEIDGYEQLYEMRMQEAELLKKKMAPLCEELHELEQQKKLLQLSELTEEELQKIRSQLHQLRMVVNSDIIEEVDLVIIDFSLTPSEEDYMTDVQIAKHLGELYILLPGTELTEKGLKLHITVKTNRPVVKALLHESMNVKPEGNWYFWSREETPTKRLMKESD
jgi:hypothetical protein